MFQGLGLLLSLAFAGRAFLHWRWCLFGMAFIAAIQDPIRKLTPGAPGYLVMLTAPILLAAMAGLILGYRRWWSDFAAANPHASGAFALLLICCLPPALISATYGPGSWIYTVLGAASYGVVLMAVVLGFHLLRSEREMRRFLAFYCIVTAVMLSGGWLEFLGMFASSQALGTEALDMTWIRYRQGFTVDLIAGFYRSPDVMGWHAAACTMFAAVLALTSRGSSRWFWIAIAIIAIGALLLCGRRKMVFMVPLFVIAVLWIYWQAGKARRLVGIAGLLALPLAGVFLFVDVLGGEESAFLQYYTGGSLETLDSVENHGFGAVVETYRQTGFLGGGLGFATPGAHQLAIPRPRVWQESGPSRVMFELGLPGMMALALALAVLVVSAWKVTRQLVLTGGRESVYTVGLLAFFLCNAGSLVVSGQILGDPFIASMIGVSLGWVLGFRKFTSQRAVPSLALKPRSSIVRT